MSHRKLWCAVIVATLFACGRPASPPDPPALAQRTSEDPFNPSAVRKLEVEHSATFGQSPTYRVSICDDGKYEYEGIEFVSQIGRRAGSTYAVEFEPLFRWLRDRPALYAANSDRTHGNDLEAVTFRFGLKSGETIVVQYSLGFQGDELWALSSIVDGLIVRALSSDQERQKHERKLNGRGDR
jgi:hypothetical protein